MNVHSIDHLNLTVEHLQTSIEWYEKVFNFTVVEHGQRPNGPWAIIRSGDAMLCLYEHPNRSEPDNFLHDREQHVVNYWGLRITDKEAWLDIIERHEIPLEYGGENKYPFSSSWYISDPSGHTIEVTCWNENVIQFAS